jgi:hypothetical protein
MARDDEVEEAEDPANRRARLRAHRRARKGGPRPMAVSGKSVFLIKQAIERRARAARQRAGGDSQDQSPRGRRDGKA